MLRNIRNSIRNLMMAVLLALFVLSTGACSGIEYIDNSTLREMDLRDKKVSTNESGIFPKQLGALAIGGNKATGDEGRIFRIKRQGSGYTAQTILVDNAGVGKASFEKSYLTFGSDKNMDSFRIELKFVY